MIVPVENNCSNCLMVYDCLDFVPKCFTVNPKYRTLNKVDKWCLESPQKIAYFAINYGKIQNKQLAKELGIKCPEQVTQIAKWLNIKLSHKERKVITWFRRSKKIPKEVSLSQLSKAMLLLGYSPEQVGKLAIVLVELEEKQLKDELQAD